MWMGEITRPNSMLPMRDSCYVKDTDRLNVKGWKQILPAGVATLTPDKTYF